MLEIYNIAEAVADLVQSIGGLDFIVPKAGVGGGMEAKESVVVVSLVKFTFAFMASIAALFGTGLALAAKKFAVKIDPRVEHVKDVLAGAHCFDYSCRTRYYISACKYIFYGSHTCGMISIYIFFLGKF